jgi:hypothetical protein
MSRSTWTLILLAAVLGGIYVVFFSDWFGGRNIQIIPQIRPARNAEAATAVYPVSFTLDDRYKLTRVRVVELAALLSNRNATAVWDLRVLSNAPPVQGFIYGTAPEGLGPAKTGAAAEPLEPYVTYRLLLEAGRAKGSVDFQTQGIAPPPQ